MRQKDQKMRYTDTELSLIKSIFAGDDTYLYAVRKHLLGVELTEGERNALASLSDESKALINKVFMPTIDGDAPLFQLVDMQMGLNGDIKGKSREEADDMIAAKKLEMDYMESRLNALNGIFSDVGITLTEMADLSNPNAFINITARNYLLSYIDSFCNEMKILSSMRDNETVQQTAERLAKDSTK